MKLSRDIGIDLGTANILVYEEGKGIVLREPSVVAVDKNTGKVLQVGAAARNMLGRTPGNIVAVRPLRDGVISDYEMTEKMLEQFLKKIVKFALIKPRVIVCVPSGVTEVEERAVIQATMEAGARRVYLIEEPFAAALGAKLNISAPDGHMIVDIGGGTTEVAVLSLGGIVLSTSLRIAGDELDEAIIAYIKRKYNILIGDVTAEMLKKRIGSVHPAADRGEMRVQGRNLLNGLPAIVAVNSAEIREAMEDQIQHIVESIRTTLENTPPELAADIYDTGIMLSGGGAMLAGLPLLISRITGIRTVVAKSPIDSVVTGIGRIIESEGIAANARFRSR